MQKKIIAILSIVAALVITFTALIFLVIAEKADPEITDGISKETEQKVMIQETVFKKAEGYTEKTETLEITNNPENFLINGDVVTEEIRIQPKTALTVNVVNNSDFETTLHFHGINADSNMDGVAGLTQEAIKPGETFTYQFNIADKGTYMYHAHLDSANQVNNENLYGGLVVEDRPASNSDMLIYNTNIDNIDQHRNASLTYDEVLVNGKGRSSLKIDNDENIYLNMVNLSSAPISIDFGEDVRYRISSIDANPAESDWQTNHSLIVPTAQRFIVEIENPKRSFQVSTSLKNKTNARYDVIYKGEDQRVDEDFSERVRSSMMTSSEYDNLASDGEMIYDLVNTTTGLDLADERVNVKTTMELSMSHAMWVINDKAFPDADSINVDEGNIVEVTLKNPSHMAETHPFHLHGHKFQVIEVNGKKLEEELVLDTIDVRPDYEIKIRLLADNPGIWAFHCHNLTHAAKGMMTTLDYKGYATNVELKAAE